MLRYVLGIGRKKRERKENLTIQTYFNCCAPEWKCRHIINRVGRNEENVTCWGKTSIPTPFRSPPNSSTHLKPDYTKKVQCNYNNIIGFHQSTVTCTGTWSCIGWGRCRPDTLPTAAWETRDGDAKLFDIFTADISRVLYILCARILSNLWTAWSLSLCWRDRGRIQKIASRGQHIMLTKHLCGKEKTPYNRSQIYATVQIKSCNENYHKQTYIR